MTSSDMYEEIDDLLDGIRYCLIQARMYSQESEACEELDQLYGPDYEGFGKAKALRAIASRNRKRAKGYLVGVEELNGSLFLAGDPPRPLSYYLNGKAFKKWPEYQSAYATSSLFKGIDPS